MDELIKLKKNYNKVLERNGKAEEYLNTHTVEECINQKFKGKTVLDLFNEVTQELSKLMKQIENIISRKMTKNEVFNGFK